MRWRFVGVSLTGLLVVIGLSGCGSEARPRPGDTVRPTLAGSLIWTAGQTGQIAVRLQAQGQDDPRPRWLDFSGVPRKVDPIATIHFYEGDQELSPIEVKLSHRC